MIRTLQHRAIVPGRRGIHGVHGDATAQRRRPDRRRGRLLARVEAGWWCSGPSRWCWPPARSARRGKITSNSWEYTGDSHALALWAGADLVDMEFVQFHPTGMVWPPSVRGILVTEGVQGDGKEYCATPRSGRFMFDYIPEMFRAETAETEEEADRWYDDRKNNRRTPDLLPP